MKPSKLLILALLASMASRHAQAANVPELLSYQAFVSDASGNPIGAAQPVNRTVTFKLYDAATGGNLLYAESQTVTIAGGNFSVLIGNGVGIAGLPGPAAPANPANVRLGSIAVHPLYLGITVDDGTPAADPEISPRQQLVSSAFALRAAVAEALASGSLKTEMIDDASITTNKIVAGGITTSRIADANITTDKLAFGSVTASKINTSEIGIWTPHQNHVFRPAGTNVGIGQSQPAFPLHFASGTGNKIALSGDSGNHYGIGVQSNLLQIYSNGSSSDIAFGFGSSTAFTENLRFKGNGNVGIGTNNPAQKLHIVGNAIATPANWTSGGTAHVYLGDTNHFVSATQNGVLALRSLGALSLRSGGDTERARLDSNGNFGVNRGNPQTRFEISPISNSSNQNNGLRLSTTGTPGTSAYRFADFRLKSDGSGNFRATLDVNNNGSGSATEAIRIGLGTGNVGIHSGADFGRLNVGSLPQYRYFSRARFVGSGVNTSTTHTDQEVAIFADGVIQADRIDLIDRSNVLSDARAKNIIQVSSSANDLATLLGIEITDYTQKDHLMLGEEARKKVIAQQVEEVFPQAISSKPGFIPDIYAIAEVRDGWILLETDLSPGDRIKLISEQDKGVYDVMNATPEGIQTNLQLQDGDVFIYGREVPDLRRVDYDAIAMLNVSATQELHRRLAAAEEAVTAKDRRIGELERRLAAIEEMLASGH